MRKYFSSQCSLTFENSQASANFPYHNSMKMKYWNNPDSRKPQYSEQNLLFQSQPVGHKISPHGLVRNRKEHPWRKAATNASAMAWPFKLKQSTLLIKIHFAPHKDHRAAICKAARLMLHPDMKRKLSFQQNAVVFNFTRGGTYWQYRALKSV